jgi:hypothetical protein
MKFKTKLPATLGGGEAELEVSKEEGSAMKRFFGAATPGFVKDRVGIWNDNARLARFENFCKIVNKAEKIRKKYKIESRTLPLKLGVKFIEDASLEDNETIQSMWANLLANSDSGKTSASSIYMSILKSMTPAEATVLNSFYQIIKGKIKHYGNDPRFFILSRDTILNNLNKEFTDSEVILDYLIKQGLVEYVIGEPHNRLTLAFNDVKNANPYLYDVGIGNGGGGGANTPSESEKVIEYLKSTNKKPDKDSLQLTSLGFALVRVCNEPEG